MSLASMKELVQGQAARSLFWGKTHSPVILLAAGTVGVVGTVVLACRATLKVSDVLDQHDEDKQRIADRNADSEERFNKELRSLQIKTALQIAKPYIPALALGLVSIAALTGSHVILTKRNSAIMVAYAGLDKAFKEYRGRVREEYGVDVDRKFAVGAESVEVRETMADGKVVTKTEEKVTGKFGGSPYAVIFDEQSRKFSKAPGQNVSTVQMQQSFMNDKLKAQGHLTLNEVYDALDLPRTTAGFVVGWRYLDKTRYPEHTGDNYVDFGFFTGYSEDVQDFMDNKNYYITLDFNVDGVIYDKI